MKKNSPRFFKFLKTGLFLLGFLFFGFNGFGQSIGTPEVTETVVCSNSFITVNFDLTSGAGKDRRYENYSTFIVNFFPQNGVNSISKDLTINNIPGNNSSESITKVIDITDLNLIEGNYSISIQSFNPDKESVQSEVFAVVNPSFYAETETGTDSWIGHVYEGTNFNTYIGGYTENEEFSQNFGGNDVDFVLGNDVCSPSVNTQTFSIRYKNQSSRRGLYVVDLTSDDGIRFKINNELIHDNWVDRAPATDNNVLLNLDQNLNDLEYEYYENTGQNEVAFENLRVVSVNSLGGVIQQVLCGNETAEEITADALQTFNGISFVGTGYQWYYSTTPNGQKNIIPNATAQNFTPDVSAEPFINPGEYYIFRKVSIRSENNRLNGNYDARIYENFSNSAQITILSTPELIDFNIPAEVCSNQEFNITGSINGQAPFQVEGTINGSAFSYNNIPADFSFPFSITGSTTIVIEKITANNGSGCAITLNESRTIEIGPNTWFGTEGSNWNNPANWSCNTLPTSNTDVLIPENLASGNYPEINDGANAYTRDLTIETGASVVVTDNWLRIAGNLTNNEILNVSAGSVSFEGASTQTIPTAAFENNRVQNLRINNASGVTSEAIIELTGELLVETGNFNSGNQLTLISTGTQTALIDGSGSGEVVGEVTMQRYLDRAFGYKYFSSPFSASKVGDFTDIDLSADFPNFYRYDENRRIDSLDLDATGWEAYTNAPDLLNVMEGYALNFGAATTPLTVSLTGEVNNGNYSLNLENNHREYTKGFHLVGNPYPSPIDWDAAGWTKTNIDDQIHFFAASDDNRYTGTYESRVNGVAQNGGNATSIIPSMQGFFVKVSDSVAGQQVTSGTLGISNAVRVNNFSQQFYRTQEASPVSLVRLNAAFKGSEGKDGMVIYFENGATRDFESDLDAHKLMNTDANVPNLYSLSSKKEQLSINAVAWPDDGKKSIPLGIKAERSGTLSISLQDLENLPYDFAVFLKDKEKNKTIDLRKQSYAFEVKPGEINSRFELLFSDEPILINEDLGDEFFSVYNDQGQMQVELNLDEKEEAVLNLSTVTGQLLETKAGRGKAQVNFGGFTSSGIYFVILEKDGKRYAKKVLIRR